MDNKTRIFEFLYKNSENSYNINQIARLVGISVGSVFKILKNFEAQNYVHAEKKNKELLYRISLSGKTKDEYYKVEGEKNSKTRKKTKIICTIGKNLNSPGFIRKLADKGMDAARIDISACNENDALKATANIRSASEDIPIILDVPKVSQSSIKKWARFALKNDLDFICVSFVRNAGDIRKINHYLGYRDIKQVIGNRIKVIVKIEKDAIMNYKEIVQESYGVMIDGDSLVADSKYETLPVFQRMVIGECNRNGKPAIIATKILESMINNPNPKKSEVSGIANAVLDGASCLMLSKDILEGKFPFKAVETMSRIIKNVENESILENTSHWKSKSSADFIGDAMLGMESSWKIDAILVITSGGYSARTISGRRLRCRIIAATSSKKVFRQLNILWGVEPLFIDANLEDISNEEKKEAILKALKKGFIKKSDQIAIIASVFHSNSKRSNLLEIHKVDEFLSYMQDKGKKEIKISGAN